MLKIHSIESLGTHEGPGIRFVVFLQGCNYRCLYCHNVDTQNLEGGKETPDEELLRLIENSKPYYKNEGGVTFSGGEPLMQAEDLKIICQKIKERGFNIALDTNGSILTPAVKELLEFVDLILLDIKHIDPIWHEKITGQKNDAPLAFAQYLKDINKPIWLRYVLVPGYTDQPEFLEKLGQHFKDYGNVKRMEILPYHTFGVYKFKELGKEYELEKISPPTPDQIAQAKKITEPYFAEVIIR